MSYSLDNQVVLITGGSQGLGKQFARKYYSDGKNSSIVIVSRSEKKLICAIEEIVGDSKIHGERFLLSKENCGSDNVSPNGNHIYYYPCNLSNYDNVGTLFELMNKKGLKPTQALSCAGGSVPKLFKDLSPAELQNGITMNYSTVLNLSHNIIKNYSDCHLILFSSVTAFFPFIGYSQYQPLKESIKALAAILRQENSKQRISVVYPGNFQSEGYEQENLTKPEVTKVIEGPSDAITCEECCNKIIWWLQKGYDDITTDFIGWFLMALDMGLNKHDNKSPFWFVQLIMGAILNLLIVPIYMVIVRYQISSYYKSQKSE
ncbi:hypothetical protein TPHA_0O01500 [Tetrapisispora phaffii CBS 4417]|uniref:3-ketodihydrosphingosine reductase TSC10 n=1 Tax=Tetrapisispora phaffii (strain ATCC 24235 / CBS 4417 / NBRC 1672 / NRRL Y-8282 / UCD 70-5) TaxID=1071381 RepID=G8C1T9_TETPH|nr:hypothetical protein TPHA_0O01500 [Tetrapisispora phaffii CBS 4417]CCE66117.1 hypothetical protein TPHA_0O01500 [Tetrapisispora phaffii CBS 4417]